MKIKKVILTLALVSMAIFLAACAKSSTPEASTDDAAVTSTANNSRQTDNSQGNRPGGQRKRPDLFGQVQKIIGNEVTLKVAEMPARAARPAGATASGGQQGDALAGASSTLGSGNQGGQVSGGQGGPPGGGGFGGGTASTIKYSGKTEKLIIPVGVPITSMKRSATGEAPTLTQLNISEITEGTMLQIYYAESAPGEEKTVESVSVMQARAD